jgi:hypothetical protein
MAFVCKSERIIALSNREISPSKINDLHIQQNIGPGTYIGHSNINVANNKAPF